MRKSRAPSRGDGL